LLNFVTPLMRRPANASPVQPGTGGCAGALLLNTALLCGDPLDTEAVAARPDGSCAPGLTATFAGLCLNAVGVAGSPPDAASGLCAAGFLNRDGVCVLPPAAAVGSAPGYAGSCAAGQVLNAFKLCVTPSAGSVAPLGSGACATGLLDSQGLCIDPRCAPLPPDHCLVFPQSSPPSHCALVRKLRRAVNRTCTALVGECRRSPRHSKATCKVHVQYLADHSLC